MSKAGIILIDSSHFADVLWCILFGAICRNSKDGLLSLKHLKTTLPWFLCSGSSGSRSPGSGHSLSLDRLTMVELLTLKPTNILIDIWYYMILYGAIKWWYRASHSSYILRNVIALVNGSDGSHGSQMEPAKPGAISLLLQYTPRN